MTGDSEGAALSVETDKADELTKWTVTPPRIGKRLHTVGFWITGIWLVLIAAYVIADFGSFRSLEPNEFGDFAAGAAAPLAFLWLVLGFFQQGEELRHSADALRLQGQELQNSVEQQRELVNVTREQLAFDASMLEQERQELVRNAQPILRLSEAYSSGTRDGKRDQTFRIFNQGKRCTDVKIYVGGPENMYSAGILEPGRNFEFSKQLSAVGFEPFEVVVTYLDERLMQGKKEFIVGGTVSKYEIVERVQG